MSAETLSGASGAAVPTVGSSVGSVEIATPVIPSVTAPISSMDIGSTIDINGGTFRPGVSIADLQSLPEHSVSLSNLHPDVSFVTEPITKPGFSTIARPDSKAQNPLSLPEYRINPENIHIDRYISNPPIFNPNLFKPIVEIKPQLVENAVTADENDIVTSTPQPKISSVETTRPQKKLKAIGIETLLNPFTQEIKPKEDEKVLVQNEISETQGQQSQTTDLVQTEVEVETQAVVKLASQILENNDLKDEERAFFMEELMKVAATKNLPVTVIENLTRLKLSASPETNPGITLRERTAGSIEDQVDSQEELKEPLWKLYSVQTPNHIQDTEQDDKQVKTYYKGKVRQSELEQDARVLAQQGAKALIKEKRRGWRPVSSLPFREPQEAERAD
jgi:hypothetical protein